jgi:MFS family permease
MKTYPLFKTEYAFLNAIMLTVLGFCSNLLGGIIGDKFESKSLLTKGLICTISGILSIPLIALATAAHGSFWTSIIAMATYIFVSGTYNSACVTMI